MRWSASLRRRAWTVAAALAATGSLLLGAASAHAAPPGNYARSTSDGGSWVADLPANWNGTLVLYSHGYGTTDPSDAPDDDTKAALLARGYALAGSGLGPPSGTVPDVRHRCTSATLGSGDGTSSLEQLLRHRHIEFPCEGHRA
jgi:hypothetical protein